MGFGNLVKIMPIVRPLATAPILTFRLNFCNFPSVFRSFKDGQWYCFNDQSVSRASYYIFYFPSSIRTRVFSPVFFFCQNDKRFFVAAISDHVRRHPQDVRRRSYEELLLGCLFELHERLHVDVSPDRQGAKCRYRT